MANEIIDLEIQREMPTEGGSEDPDDWLLEGEGGIIDGAKPNLYVGMEYPWQSEGRTSPDQGIIENMPVVNTWIKKPGDGDPILFKIREAAMMWCRNTSDNSLWSFDGSNWSKKDNGPGWVWSWPVWDGTNLYIAKGEGYGAKETWLFDGSTYTKLSDGYEYSPGLYRAYKRPTFVGNSEFWAYINWGSVFQSHLIAFNVSTNTWRLVESYYNLRKGGTDYYANWGFAWTGSYMFHPSAWLKKPQYWNMFYLSTYTEAGGSAHGSDLSPPYVNTGSTVIWAGKYSEMWFALGQLGTELYAASNTSSYYERSPSPGFSWVDQAIWTGTNLWCRNPADETVHQYDGSGWSQIGDSPGFSWNYPVYVGNPTDLWSA